MERVFDLIFSSLALILLLPLFTVIILLLRFTGEGEIFYLQKRLGRNGEMFSLIKFATMLKDSPKLGTGTITMKNDPRVLPVGSFLRKTKINELPQLLNIFLGNMSVVGPRPLTKETFNAYSDEVKKNILTVRPGLSGVGSIIFRNEEDILSGSSASLDFYEKKLAPYKGTLESWFVKNRSIHTYFKCILITLYVVCFPKSSIAWRVLDSLPKPPKELRVILKYPF